MGITHLLDYVLEDDYTETGGIAFMGETVRDFIEDSDPEKMSLEELNRDLVACGIKPMMKD